MSKDPIDTNESPEGREPDGNDFKRLKSRPEAPTPQYEVGYGKPPMHTRFQKGVSGNPEGRKKGSSKPTFLGCTEEKLKQLLQHEVYREVSVSEGGKTKKISAAHAMIRGMTNDAMRGDHKVRKFIFENIRDLEEEHQADRVSLFNTAIEYKMSWKEEFERCRKAGLPLPTPIPHPDNVIIDYDNGTVRIIGPRGEDEREKARRELEFHLALQLDDLAEEEKYLAENPGSQSTQKTIEQKKELIARIQKALDIDPNKSDPEEPGAAANDEAPKK